MVYTVRLFYFLWWRLLIDVLAGIKVLHGLDKVMGGGAVVLTLKDQNILSDGDLNEEIFDMVWSSAEGYEVIPQERWEKAGLRKEQERSEAEMRNSAYRSAYAKADEASKSLRLEQTPQTKEGEEESLVFADDDEDIYKALERIRKLALKKEEAEASGPLAIALLATSTLCSQIADDQNPEIGESLEKNLSSLRWKSLSQLSILLKVYASSQPCIICTCAISEVHKTDNEDVFMDEDEPPRASDEEQKDEAGGWMEVQDSGLSGALKLLKERGNDAGNNNDNKFKDIRIERTDKFGLTCLWMLISEQWHCFEGCFIAATVQLVVSKMRSERFSYASGYKLVEETELCDGLVPLWSFSKMTPKEALCMISHKFHGKGPGKMKQYQEELKLKQVKNSDTPSLSVERMREAQAQLKTPYLVLSSHVKPGQTSDPRSGFATVDKDLPGALTPMLGDKKNLLTPKSLTPTVKQPLWPQLIYHVASDTLSRLQEGWIILVSRKDLTLIRKLSDQVEHFLGIKRKLETENSSAHQRSLKFESVVIFCWRTHGSKRDSENLRAHYSVSLTLKGTHSDGYGYFSICFGTV
ncbi:hypothetical protein Peur_019968 [Populus x canadensis]